ncbi:MAG: LysR substrate-binding domain-containing protein [Colwellia sp.]|nr:LysR substrate-binding domain-containing protein [Colwellia sp.]MCW8864603.1 LysR substrate-binding domain-containing protein [Colwellia sp.]MCW9081531.1 LysR substrate-binding domain-containing protein [Colwellia sp.]
MNLRDLKYLVTVANTGHFGHAAERCFVSQPTLSGQIKKLEEELGITVFERTKRSVEITPLGDAIVTQAKRVLEQADILHQLAQSNQDPLVAPLRMGVIPTLSPYLMPLILKPLKNQYPQTKLVITEELTDTLLLRLGKHEIDAALIATPVEEPEFESIALFDEPFWLIHPKNHALAAKKKIIQADLNSADLLLLAEGHCLAEQTMQICHMQERDVQGDMADLRAASLETLLQMVAAGFGTTLIPALAMKTASARDESLITRELQFPDTYRRISLVYRRTFPRRQALELFSKLVLKNLPDNVQPCP